MGGLFGGKKKTQEPPKPIITEPEKEKRIVGAIIGTGSSGQLLGQTTSARNRFLGG